MSVRALGMMGLLSATFPWGSEAAAAPTASDPTRVLVIRAAKGSETTLTTVIDRLFELACQKLVPGRYADVVKYGDNVDPGVSGKALPPDPLNAPLDILDQQTRSAIANSLVERCVTEGQTQVFPVKEFDALVVNVIDKANRNVNLTLRFISTPPPPATGTRIERKWNPTGLDNFDDQQLASFVDCVAWTVWRVEGPPGPFACKTWGLTDRPRPVVEPAGPPASAVAPIPAVDKPPIQSIPFHPDVAAPESKRWPVWVLGGAGGAGLGVGLLSTFLVGHYQSKVDLFVSGCGQGKNDCAAAKVSSWENRARAAEKWQWSYAIGGALLTAGAAYLLKDLWLE
jgi:hypothetical protein